MMTDLTSLWLPILFAAVVCHIASFILWAASPWHKPDIRPVPDLDAADAAINGLDLNPGFYLLPCTHDADEMKSQAFKDRYKRGPWAGITIMGSQPNMVKNLLLTLLVFFVVSIGIAYLAASVLAPGTAYTKVFQVTCTAGVLAYTFGGVANGIWFGKPTGWAIRDVIDASIYAMITAGMFSWLWPGSPVLPLP
ncbi:MAG: hypothetical protein AB8F26_13155 [Phycisphaerales bacterium]